MRSAGSLYLLAIRIFRSQSRKNFPMIRNGLSQGLLRRLLILLLIRSRFFIRPDVRQKNGTRFKAFMFSNFYKSRDYYGMIGKDVVVCGKVSYDEQYGFGITPELIDAQFIPRMFPVYPNIKGVPEDRLIRETYRASDMLPELLETEVRRIYSIGSFRDAITTLHNPASPEEIKKAAETKTLYELAYFSMELFGSRAKQPASNFMMPKTDSLRSFIGSLPFTLTKDQAGVIYRFIDTANAGKRNNILLQGDVGCGKTVVAAAVMMCAAENGYQGVFMAPREALAEQHYREISGYAEKAGIPCVFLRQGMKAAERKAALKILKTQPAFAVGTHSCISADVEYKKLGVIVTDEEHLFGVNQKNALEAKASEGVHSITMSATPIPRTLAGVLYGEDKTVEVIRSMPEGRLPIQTAAITARGPVFDFIVKQKEAGFWTYVVCPAIENNEDTNITSVEEIEGIYRHVLEPRGIRIGVVHGRQKREENARIIESFSRGEINVLISTTVIEVGINVPEATLMVIEQADRFGLASMHQLRGRVGRSVHQSYCVLVTEKKDSDKVKIMCETTDGFRIAEEDMRIRGTGNLIGVEQSGMNKYISQMLVNPDLYQKARQVTEYCQRFGCGRYLLDFFRRIDG